MACQQSVLAMRISTMRTERTRGAQAAVLLGAFVCAVAGNAHADGPSVDCWPSLIERFHAVSLAVHDGTEWNDADRESRLGIAATLARGCTEAPFIYEVEGPGPDRVFVTLLDMAIIANDAGSVERVLGRGHRWESPDARGMKHLSEPSSVGTAVYFESPEALEVLLTRGAAVNVQDSKGATPLHLASVQTEKGLRSLASLVRAGANLETKTTTGYTPLEVAVINRDSRKAQCLHRLGSIVPKEFNVSPPSPRPLPEDVVAERSRILDLLSRPSAKVPDDIESYCRK